MRGMSEHSIIEARDRLSELIDRALAGEEVVIIRDGRPVVALRPMQAQAPERPVTAADLDWLAARRITGRKPTEDAGTLVSRMRDEDWER
jgi:prevent-host-death family protein